MTRYYVCGFMDTGTEFIFKGVTTSKAKADAWVKKQQEARLGQMHRDWPIAVKTSGI